MDTNTNETPLHVCVRHLDSSTPRGDDLPVTLLTISNLGWISANGYIKRLVCIDIFRITSSSLSYSPLTYQV